MLVNYYRLSLCKLMIKCVMSMQKEVKSLKKLVATMMVAVAASVLSPSVPQAHAAGINDMLAQAVEQGVATSRIEELIKMKQGLEGVGKDGIVTALSSLAQDRISQNSIDSVIGNADVKKAVETALREQVEKEVSKQLAPYQEQLNVFSAFINGGTRLTPSSVSENESLTGAPENYRRVIDMTATAYAPGPLDNGKWNSLTYVGGTVKKGVVAVDPRVIPMGSKLWVEGYGEAIAEDQGSAIKGNRIDLAFNDRQEALDYGIKKVKVYVLN